VWDFVILPKIRPREKTLRDREKSLSGRGTSVRDDWRARLSEEKSKVFCAYVRELESAYGMLSVSLNEAIELRLEGRLAKSWQAVNATPELCSRLTSPLASLIHALGEHAKHFGTVPNTAPLDAANFQSPRGQRSARMSGMLSRVLFSQRTQFLHKLGTLQEMVEDLGKEFCSSAEELGGGLSTDATILWDTVDADHYDINTCLRETFVLLKSFLRALPDDQLAGFQKSVLGSWRAGSSKSRPGKHQVLRHGRMAPIAGE
jgi:hypothetical protein